MGLRSLTPFSSSPYPPIATSGLKLYLDAAKANGASFPGVGASYHNWIDLSGAGLWSSPTWNVGTGTNEGWIGDGSTSNPFALNIVTIASSSVVGNTNFGITGNAARTITAWVLDSASDTGNDPGEFAGWGHTGSAGTLFYLTRSLASNNNWGLWGFTVDTATSIASADGIWHCIVGMTNGSGSTTVYIDGVSRGTGTSKTFNTADVFRLGQGVSTFNSMLGKIAVVAVHNRALTSTEVTSFYNSTKATFGH